MAALGWPGSTTPGAEALVDLEQLLGWAVPSQMLAFALTERPAFVRMRIHGELHVVERRLEFGPQVGGEERAGLLDQHRHLVADEADVGALVGDHRQQRTVADTGDEQERMLHLHDDLGDRSSAEAPGGAVAEADQARCHRGEPVDGITVKPGGGGDRKPVR